MKKSFFRWLSLSLVALSALLTGCAAVPSGAQIAASLNGLHERALAREDEQQARLVQQTKGVVSLRTQRLAAFPKTVQALKEACNRTPAVEVFLASNARQEANTLQGSCAQVYLSNHVALVKQEAVLLVDADQMMVQGQRQWPSVELLQQEVMFRQGLRQMSWRLQ